MNTHPQNGRPHGPQTASQEARFDAAMRELHRAALANVSPQVRWKLKPRASAAKAGLAGMPGAWRRGPLLAAPPTAALAIALGTMLWRPEEPSDPAATPVVADNGAAGTGADDGAGEALVLEQDPDFYAWLASDDAELIAME